MPTGFEPVNLTRKIHCLKRTLRTWLKRLTNSSTSSV